MSYAVVHFIWYSELIAMLNYFSLNWLISAPSQGPLVFPSGFSSDNHPCETPEGMRNITLYWKV